MKEWFQQPSSTRRFENTYFSYDGYYLTGDGARRDADGHYWITGRVDDVVVVSGHNIGTAEVESALVAATFEDRYVVREVRGSGAARAFSAIYEHKSLCTR